MTESDFRHVDPARILNLTQSLVDMPEEVQRACYFQRYRHLPLGIGSSGNNKPIAQRVESLFGVAATMAKKRVTKFRCLPQAHLRMQTTSLR